MCTRTRVYGKLFLADMILYHSCLLFGNKFFILSSLQKMPYAICRFLYPKRNILLLVCFAFFGNVFIPGMHKGATDGFATFRSIRDMLCKT